MHPRGHPVHNFFCRRDGRRVGRYRAGETARGSRRAAAGGVKSKNSNALKTHISSAFSQHAEIFAENRASKKFFRAAARRPSRRAPRATAGGGAYTQN